MFENNELGHVSFPLALDILFSQQFCLVGDCRACHLGPETDDELRLHAF
jgi:hypothetical protein